MLIDFKTSNFLSFNDEQVFSLKAGKARKYSKRLFNNKKYKLTKFEVILGANASGKSNLIYAFKFMRDVILNDLPKGFSDKYFRMNPEKKDKPSNFEVVFLIGNNAFKYGFSILLSSGKIIEEYLYEISSSNNEKLIFERNTLDEKFNIGTYFKGTDAITKIVSYGEDSIQETEILFLSIMNRHKQKMYEDIPELKILNDIFNWFAFKINISFPDSVLSGYPYFSDSNLQEIVTILHALGTGISNLKIVELPFELAKSKIPDEIFNQVVADLEKEFTRKDFINDNKNPRIMLRSYKEFYTFEIDKEKNITITTIEFAHENSKIYFDLNEESDGTARILDLIEIFTKLSQNSIFIIDELDRCLHPSMTVKIIEMFLKLAEERNTQLIITSHESRLLAADILRNDEICFISKNANGESIINPLEKYQLRADKSIYAALFDGTLESIPTFNDKELHNMIDKGI